MSLHLDPALACDALRRIATGQIVSDDGLLRRSNQTPLDEETVSALQALHRHGYIALSVRRGLPVAELTMTGTQLLDTLNRHQDQQIAVVAVAAIGSAPALLDPASHVRTT